MASAGVCEKIVAYFISHAPATELPAVVKDLRILGANSSGLDDAIKTASMKYQVETLGILPLGDHGPKTAPLLICSFSDNGDGSFYHYGLGKSFVIDPVTCTVLSAEEGDDKDKCPGNRKVLRDAISKALSVYIADHFAAVDPTAPSVTAAAAHGVYISEQDVVTVLASSTAADVRNRWSGRWRCVYTINLSGGAASTCVGTTTADVHYYEQGNVAMHSFYNPSVKVNVAGSDADIAAAIVKAVELADAASHTAFDAGCTDVQAEAVRTLRRKMPRNKTLFNFRSGAHAVAKELTSKAGGH